jgi:predicted ATPase/DNA-binding winged helix-turn-helix (wHTH) protein/Tfp pilus assembly protein PilF
MRTTHALIHNFSQGTSPTASDTRTPRYNEAPAIRPIPATHWRPLVGGRSPLPGSLARARLTRPEEDKGIPRRSSKETLKDSGHGSARWRPVDPSVGGSPRARLDARAASSPTARGMKKRYKIGPLDLDPEARVLTHDGAPVPLGARGVAVLAALVSRGREVVQKPAIMEAAWPGLVVEDANLAVQISAIRRALARVPGGESWIETLARRGYRFVGPVVEVIGPAEPVANSAFARTNLPQVLNSFVGRGRELAQIKQRLPDCRLLTLTGTGGIGKTRLALHAAGEMRAAYGDGVWFVDFAPLLNPALVESAVAQALRVEESAGKSLVEALCEHLQGKRLLLVLDNCEHLLKACAGVAAVLLRESTGVTLLATSREALRVEGEEVYPLDVLPLPDPNADVQVIASADAVQLFVERVRQHHPRFNLHENRARAVAEICLRLDGVPLALELAAARVAVLPVEQILRMLDQRFRLLTSGNRSDLPRQQTLRAMIDWSYDLLDAAEKQLFARLSVFAGGWTLAAAERIGEGDGLTREDVVYVLIALVEKSLVVVSEDGERYRLLETMRAYAQEKLAPIDGAQLIGARHRDYFLALAEEAEPRLTGAEQGVWLRRLEDEHDNLRTALEWGLREHGAVGALRLCGALQRFWWTRGHLSEGREWCARALAAARTEEPTAVRAKALSAAGLLAYWQGDYPAARAHHEQCLAMRRQAGDRSGAGVSLNNLGMVARSQGEPDAARALYAESLTIKRELGDRFGSAATLNNLGNLAAEQGDYRASRTHHEESLAILREMGDRGTIATALENLGSVAYDQGELAAAHTLHVESLTMRRELGDTLGIVISLERLAAVAAAVGSPLRAARVWGAAERLRGEIGSALSPQDRAQRERCVVTARAAAGNAAAFAAAWQEGGTLAIAPTIELAFKNTVERR